MLPPALALVGPSLDDSLWMALVMLMLFPGGPLIFAGHYVRRTIEEPKAEEWFSRGALRPLRLPFRLRRKRARGARFVTRVPFRARRM